MFLCKLPNTFNSDFAQAISEMLVYNNDIYKIRPDHLMMDYEEINKKLVESKQELFKFKPDYRVTILYGNNEKKVLLLKGQCIKIDGVTYRTSKIMSVMLDKLFETE